MNCGATKECESEVVVYTTRNEEELRQELLQCDQSSWTHSFLLSYKKASPCLCLTTRDLLHTLS
ncbi:hypothetical protein E2C01_007714 [Portunus trituberculatus]|uniref:Uncharacterized protein n=1 Tax=Portunus trituberculatus TaxID=210409 RepID=A0A5B7D345_PORTR|nr:hypothetical protein [Portunus trituberculatus]